MLYESLIVLCLLIWRVYLSQYDRCERDLTMTYNRDMSDDSIRPYKYA